MWKPLCDVVRLDYDDGVFTAPHEGIYYFTMKVRVADSTSGDMEIEWKKNGQDTEGGFEMWLHEYVASSRLLRVPVVGLAQNSATHCHTH